MDLLRNGNRKREQQEQNKNLIHFNHECGVVFISLPHCWLAEKSLPAGRFAGKIKQRLETGIANGLIPLKFRWCSHQLRKQTPFLWITRKAIILM